MALHDVKTVHYQDRLARHRRQRHIAGSVFIFLAVAAALGGLVYLFFFSSVWAITSVTADGLSVNHANAVSNFVNQKLNQKKLGLPVNRASLFFRTEALKAEIIGSFPFIDSIDVSIFHRHELKIAAKERKPVGIWCFPPVGGDCYFFDQTGHIMDQTASSSGYLLWNVSDQREYQQIPRDIEPALLDTVLKLMDYGQSHELRFKNIVLLQNKINELEANTSGGYPILFALDAPIQNQLETLSIFLNNKKGDPSFQPQYLDLRIANRVYYK